ncbi:MAG: CsgG/HfaB family protein [Candidatus Neomarinimicrobiota bacterium]
MKRILFCLTLVYINGQTVLPNDSTDINLKTLAVLPLEGKGISSQDTDILTQRLRSSLFKINRFQLVERSLMEEILKEQGLQQSGCTDEECAVEVGRLLGVEFMVTGTIGKIGSSYAIDIRTIEVETGKINNTVIRNYQGQIEELLNLMPDIALELSQSSDYTSGSLNPPVREKNYSEGINELADKIINPFREKREAETNINYSRDWVPFQFSFNYPVQLFPSGIRVFGLGINIIHGRVYDHYGFNIGLINQVEHEMFGLQSGLINIGGDTYGAQFGFMNTTTTLKGLQIGFINKAQTLNGVQIGIFNYNPQGPGRPFLPIINIGIGL